MFFHLSALNYGSTERARHQGRIRRRILRLEGLEDRCLLSGISAITEFPLPSGSSLSEIAARDHDRSRRQHLVHRRRRQCDRDDQPDDARHQLVYQPNRRRRWCGNHDGPRRQPLVLRAEAPTRSG